MGESLAREREALLEAQRRLLQSERLAAAGRLASGVAHEIGNPLAAILGYAEIALRDRGLSERTRETQGLLREEALRVRALIRELLDLSRSSRVEVTALGVAELLERLRARLGAQPLLEGIELAVQPGATSLDGLEVEADAGRVEQVLVNLVENAAHALGKQTQPSPRIELGWRRVECGPRRRLDDFASSSRPRTPVRARDSGSGTGIVSPSCWAGGSRWRVRPGAPCSACCCLLPIRPAGHARTRTPDHRRRRGREA
jgi:nitrogen-specific signal transduction histidine kinase